MAKLSELFLAGVSGIAVLIYSMFSFSDKVLVVTTQSHFGQSKNNPPEVKILSPEMKSIHPLNSLIGYSISVSDIEDGESKYDEIPGGKILFEIEFVEGSVETWDKRRSFNDQTVGLGLMINSSCFTCHQFQNNLVGPSFQEIANRYSKTASGNKLVASLRKGSTGIWGEALMPAHPDISMEESEKIIDWILNVGGNPNVDYRVGKEGTFRMELPPGALSGFFVLKASYTDTGLKDQPKERLSGEDVIVIRYK